MSTIFFKKLHTAASNLRASHTAFFGFMHCLQYVFIRYSRFPVVKQKLPSQTRFGLVKKG